LQKQTFLMLDGKVILWLRDRVCEDAEDLLASEQFVKFISRCLTELKKKNSKLLGIFGEGEISDTKQKRLIDILQLLAHLPAEHVLRLVDGSQAFFENRSLFNDFVEYLYNYWRHFQRLIISQSDDEENSVRPYRTFNRTIEHLTTLVRNTYRDIQENITGNRPRIYRQVSAGAEISTITRNLDFNIPEEYKEIVKPAQVIRQVLMYPPLIFNSASNKRTGVSDKIDIDPCTFIKMEENRWLCYPALVGDQLILVYFSIELFELGFALCNLFELATDSDLEKKVDSILFFGLEPETIPQSISKNTVFFDDLQNDMLVGVVPNSDTFGYFGYLKKLILTLHNIKMMKRGRLPFHGALFKIKVKDHAEKNVLIMGDTGAGKSETLEAIRAVAGKEIEDITIVADDMGSLEIDKKGNVIGFGSEIGAFVRLDDLQPGYAFGQMDRAVIMNANQVNARVVIPVTTYQTIVTGHQIDYALYANNYVDIEKSVEAIFRFTSVEEALNVFRSGKVMSKGTTTTTGIVETYFANIFGPVQYQEMHDKLANKYFTQLFKSKIFVGEIRTQLGIEGKEQDGPLNSAKQLIQLIKQ
jgi:hypothetical protein